MKKTLSIIMTVAMLLGLLTTFAFAEQSCPHSEEILTGENDNFYYKSIDDSTHVMMCSECEVEIAEPVKHTTGFYHKDETSCTERCIYCYYEGQTIPHIMTGYARYDSEYCVNYCHNCGWADETGLVEHDYATYEMPATKIEGAHTFSECTLCKASKKEYSKQNNIYFELFARDYIDWDDSVIIAFENGEPITVIRNYDGEAVEHYAIPYNEGSVYSFMWLNGAGSEDFGAKIYFPDKEEPVFEADDMSVFFDSQIIYTHGEAEYDALYEALSSIPDTLEYFTKESVDKLVEAVKGVDYFVHKDNQQKVDDMTKAVKAAVEGLVPTEEPATLGVINLRSTVNVNFEEEKGYYIGGDFYKYEGDYTVFNSDGYTESGFFADSGKFNLTIINLFGAYGTLGFYDDAEVNLTALGTNVFCSSSSGYAGIEVVDNAKLTITKDSENIVAIGSNDCAGIGSWYDGEIVKAGDITIDGGVVFALSTDDGAGIGGGYKAGFGTITINDGRIHAECLDDDGAGIGVGDDGNGGDIIINGGDITALSLDDDGAGIGGGDSGHVDSITINGGIIVVGSDDGAGIGGGESTNSYGGKIIINGGTVLKHFDDSSSNFIGNDEDNKKGEDEDNFVQINGGNILDDGRIYPEPKNKDGAAVFAVEITVADLLANKELTIELKDGSAVKLDAYGTRLKAFLPENSEITNKAYLESGSACYIFTDVKAGKWYEDAVSYCYANGFIAGIEKDRFGVDTPVTRGMFITILARIAGVDTYGDANKVITKFSDVKTGKYYTNAIKWASENKIVAGITETEYKPDNELERQQLCVMIANFARYMNVELTAVEDKISFADESKIGKYAKAAVELCQRADIINGIESGKNYLAKPQDTATRAQAAQMLYVFHAAYMLG